MRKVRIGSGAGYAGDRIEPAIDLMKHGKLDYIIFECLAERTISIAQKRKQENPKLGYNDLLEYRFDRILDAWRKNPVRVITNMGAANPKSAAKKCREMAKKGNYRFEYRVCDWRRRHRPTGGLPGLCGYGDRSSAF